MITKRALIAGVAASLAMTVVFISCKKDAEPGNTPDLASAQNNSLAESNYNDVTTLVDLSARNGSDMTFRTEGVQDLTSSCATVTVDTVSSPRTITIDFGSSNCLCIDGRNRRGKILASYTGKYRDSGTEVSISFDNYFVNDNQVKGTKTVTNKGNNTAGHLVYKVEVNGEIVKANSGGTITWVSTREREWIEGDGTPLNVLDDVYGISGSASGTNADGTSYTINITQQLIRKMNCKWFESGILEITPEGEPVRSLNYGTTGCDANATITVLNTTFNIILP